MTYRDTWPHECVLSEKDGQQELLEALCDRFRAGEGVASRFFRMKNTYLFIADYKYWLMTHWDDLVPFPLEYALYRISVSPVSHSRASRNPELEAAFQYQQIYLETVLNQYQGGMCISASCR